MNAKSRTFTAKERAVQRTMIERLSVRARNTRRPLIVAMVGLVGSGKSTVARVLARQIGGTIVEGDAIRVELRRRGKRLDRAMAIGGQIAREVIRRGGNAIMDSDYVDPRRRRSIQAIARQSGSRLVLIRTFGSFDIMAGRVITAAYRNHPDDFFGGAPSPWRGSEQRKGAVVKLRELWRRTPHHYRWVNQIGGSWIPKKFPFTVFAEIDTTQPAWNRAATRCSRRLLQM